MAKPARSANDFQPREWCLGATLIPVSIGFLGLNISDTATKSRIAILGLSSGLLIGPSAGHWYAQQPKQSAFW